MKRVVIAVLIVLLAGIVLARPSLVPMDMDGIKEAAQHGKVTVLVSVADIPGATKMVRTNAKDRFAAFREQRDRHAAARAVVFNRMDHGVAITGNAVLDATEQDITILHEYDTSNEFSAVVDAAGVETLANTPGVTSIRISPQLQLALHESVPLIKADAVWNRSIDGVALNGANMAVCIIDTGIEYSHPAFAGRIADSHCFLPSSCPDGANLTRADDDNGHGTHVAGIAAGNGTYVGVAPAAQLLVAKACFADSSCDLAAMAAGVDWCVGLASTYNISAISLSISDGGHSDTIDNCPYDAAFEGAVNEAWAQGIMVSIAAGNNHNASVGIGYPACIPNATSVSATDKSDVIASYAQTGSLLDIFAPGSSITSAILGNSYGSKSGTSMATPHIAGAAALLKQNELLNNRTITPNLIEDLMKTYSSTYISKWPRIDVLEVLTARNLNMIENASANRVTTPGVASIQFVGTTALSEADNCISFSPNSIIVNTTRCPQFNKNAILQLMGLSYSSTPLVYVNDTLCTDCVINTYAGGTLTFNVTHFSSYSSGPNVNLLIFDDTDGAQRVLYQPVTFTANYSNASTGASINGTCTLSLNQTGVYDAPQTMTSTAGLYTFTTIFATAGNFTYQVNCSAAGSEHLGAVDPVVINSDTDAPSVQLLGPADESLADSSNFIHFNFNATDNSGSIARCDLIIDGAPNISIITPPISTTVSINTTLSNGVRAWSVNCTDNVDLTNSSPTYLLNISVINYPPTLLANFSNRSVAEDTDFAIDVSSYFSEPTGDPMTFSSVQDPSLLVTINQTTGNATIRGIANVSGSFNLVFVATDSLGASTQGNSIIVTVTPVNDPPTVTTTLSDKSWTAGSSKINAFYLDSYFSDVDNTTLLYTSNGTSRIIVYIDAAHHNVSFTPQSGWTGIEYIRFTASDGQYTTSSNWVKLTVNAASSSSGGGGGGGGSSCSNQCTVAGPMGCSVSGQAVTCLDTNSDGCLELNLADCPAGQECQSGVCLPKTCTSEWACGAWSECSGGSQTRSCTDLYACTTPTSQPALTQTCTVPTTETPGRPAVGAPLAAVDAAANTTPTNITTNSTCGDGECQVTEWCPIDCKSRNVKVPVVVVLFGAIGAIVINHRARTKKSVS